MTAEQRVKCFNERPEIRNSEKRFADHAHIVLHPDSETLKSWDFSGVTSVHVVMERGLIRAYWGS